MEAMFFYLVAAVAVGSGLLVVTCKNPVNSAISLVMTFVCLAALYVELHAPFMAAIQIMVYAGAIMVLILFVIMLLNLGTGVKVGGSKLVWGAGASFLLFIPVYFMLKRSFPTGTKGEITAQMVDKIGHTELIGRALFTDFLLPFEITSILLLAAIVGAVVLAKKEV